MSLAHRILAAAAASAGVIGIVVQIGAHPSAWPLPLLTLLVINAVEFLERRDRP